MLTSFIQQRLLALGFETTWGCLHKSQDYRPSLACDIIECYRGELELWVAMVLRSVFSETDFCYSDDGACRLTPSGQKIFYQMYFQQHELRKRCINKRLISIRKKC